MLLSFNRSCLLSNVWWTSRSTMTHAIQHVMTDDCIVAVPCATDTVLEVCYTLFWGIPKIEGLNFLDTPLCSIWKKCNATPTHRNHCLCTTLCRWLVTYFGGHYVLIHFCAYNFRQWWLFKSLTDVRGGGERGWEVMQCHCFAHLSQICLPSTLW